MPSLVIRFRAIAFLSAVAFSHYAMAGKTLYAYGPGGPAPAMKEAASEFEKITGIRVEVTAGPTDKWLGKARNDADLVYGGSENMMTDFVYAMPDQLSHQKVTPLFLRPYAILVRPGNPKHIMGVHDLFKPGLKILVVNGAGQTGTWEDMAGRRGNIDSVIALRKNIAGYAKNSAESKKIWEDDKSIDAWLIWNIWQVANPSLADLVKIEPDYAIYRDSEIAITKKGEQSRAAQQFVAFLQSESGAKIFAKWGWMAGPHE
jgi:accessory colonization factor AcfC